MPDWLLETLRALPALVWIFVGLGLPWALVALPRPDWRDRPMVACLTLAFGPAWLTAWMFALGTLGQDTNPNAADINPMQTTVQNLVGGQILLRPDLILAGTVLIAAIGWALVWRRIQGTARPAPTTPVEFSSGESQSATTGEPEVHSLSTGRGFRGGVSIPLSSDEKLLIFFIVAATILRWIMTSWLPFGAWDPLWVYGYQGRIYTLVGYIPADIGYYPQFIPLQYAFSQIVSIGAISDHAARAVMPFLQVGSILAVYVLGSRLFNRRTGIIAAALWSLYPHFGYWTRVGDLEIPVTFAFTGAAAFFLMAWTSTTYPLSPNPSPTRREGLISPQSGESHLTTTLRSSTKRRYALIAGLFFGIAMWTKPTAGAFVWGVLLLLAVDFVRVRGDWRTWLPCFEMAVITGLASIPLGVVWYVRNMLIGHDAIVLPDPFWLTQAERSGAEFGWILLALFILLAYLLLAPLARRPDWRGVLVGVTLVLLGVLPSIIDPHRMIWWEWLAFAAGLGVLAWTLWRGYFLTPPLNPLPVYGEGTSAPPVESAIGTAPMPDRAISTIGWASLLALPYFVTWFYSYSYHYRLSFTIVPLLLLPTAVMLAHWISPNVIQQWKLPRRFVYTLVLVAVCIPGVLIAFYDEGLGWDWLWTIPAEDDYSEAALLGVRDNLETYIGKHAAPPVVIAPGLQTLPFFFPTTEIRIMQTPIRIEDIEATHFVLSREALMAYERAGIPFQNPWLSSLPRPNVTTLVGSFRDQGFFYDVYELHPEQRFNPPTDGAAPSGDVVFGGFARYVAHRVLNSSITNDGVKVEIWWQAIQPAPEDYTIYVHFVSPDDPDTVWAQLDGPVAPTPLGWYSTTFWQPGEYIIDLRHFYLQNPDTPPGNDYRLHIGFYDPETQTRLPVTLNGEPAGDGYFLESVFSR